MKKLFTTILVLVSLAAFSQPVVQRASQANTVADARLSALLNFHLPRYQDTTSANAQIGVDSLGALIFTRSDNSVWQRSGSPKQWVKLGGSTGASLRTALNGLSVSGDTVRLGGTLSSGTVINTGTNYLQVTGAPSVNASVHAVSTSSQPAMRAVNSGTGYGLSASGVGSAPLMLDRSVSATGAISEIITSWSQTTGTPVAGHGSKWGSYLKASDGSVYLASGWASKWANATAASRTSTVYIEGVDNTTTKTFLELQPTLLRFNNNQDTVASKADVRAAAGSGGAGSMDKATYDADADNIVDNAEALNGQAPTYYLNYTNLTNKPTIPTNTNQLTNGSGFIDQAGARTAVSLTTTGTGGTATYSNTTGVFNIPVIPTNNNQLTNGSGYIANITGLVTAGTNITLTGSGTSASPYSIANGVTNTNQLTNGAGFITNASVTNGSLIAVRFIASGTTYTPTTGTTKAVFYLIAGGGGGGGVTGAASSVGAGGGGGAGGVVIKYVTGLSDATTYTIAIGTAGTGGANTGTGGVAGGNTTLTVGATTYTATGGTGGSGQTTGTALGVSQGGTAGSGTSGDVNGGGQNGDPGIRLSGTVGISGAGGTSLYGTGGAALSLAGAGNNATGYGAGGGGALSTANQGRAGGTGGAGAIIVWEFK